MIEKTSRHPYKADVMGYQDIAFVFKSSTQNALICNDLVTNLQLGA